MRHPAVLPVALVLVACGPDGDDGTTGTGSTATSSVTVSGGTASTGGAPGSGGSAGDGGSTGVGGSGGAGGAAHGPEVRVLQLNLCHSGVNTSCFTGDEVMDKAIAVIGDVEPALVTLNETCRNDVPALAAATAAVDHRFTPALKADGTPVKCLNGEDYGNGLLAWRAPEWPDAVTGVYSQQSSTSERRVWICMGYSGLVGCTTHLSTSGATALAQCQDFAGGPVAVAAAAGPVATAGDWNLLFGGTPDAQDCVPPGFFRKGDGSVQHVMVSDHFEFIETNVIDMEGTTDHPALEVRLLLR
jgi:hypothetical protein